MKKTAFKAELTISDTQQRGSKNKKDVYKIQSWLNLYANKHPASGTATGIDGDFGPSTETAVKKFQAANNLPQTGVVSVELFKKMSNPIDIAFNTPVTGNGLRQLVVNVAVQHLANSPFELTINKQTNSGPWVRAYMDGKEGSDMLWCMGFVQTILDQAASQLGKNFTSIIKPSYSCDAVATDGKARGYFIANAKVRANPSLVKPGDIFLVASSNNSSDWIHTGVVIGINGDIFETIEGNTNTDGSNNGNGVYRRSRNYKKAILDVYSIEKLV